MATLKTVSKSASISTIKRELALGYRMLGHEGLGLGLLAHLTVRHPSKDAFFSYQLGQSVEEVKIRDICEANFDAITADKSLKVNPTLRMHGVVYRARPDVKCILHHHGDNCVAMGAIGQILKPIDRSAARWHREIDIIEDYDKAYKIAEQGDAIVKVLGMKKALILKFHGILVTGRSIRDVVVSGIDLERSLGVQLKAMAAGRIATMPAKEIQDAKSLFVSDLYIDGTWNYMNRVLARKGLAKV